MRIKFSVSKNRVKLIRTHIGIFIKTIEGKYLSKKLPDDVGIIELDDEYTIYVHLKDYKENSYWKFHL
jgi:hypothetical protein